MPRYYLPKVNKFVTFSASCVLSLSGGLSYLFGVWSPALVETCGLDARQVQVVAAIGNLGGYSSFISGLVYDALERRHHVGPRLSLVLGAVAYVLGYSGIWAAVTGRFKASPWQLAALTALAANGGTWYDTCALATNLRNFPGQRGPVVGVIKAGVGLSSSLYTMVYIAAFQPNIHNFLLFLAMAPAAIGLLCLPLMNYVPYVQRSELQGGYTIFSPDGRLLLALQTVGTLALYLMAVALATAFDVGTRESRSIMALGVIFLLSPLSMLPMGSGGLFASKAPTLVRAPTDLRLEDIEEEETENISVTRADKDEGEGSEENSSLEEALLLEAAQEHRHSQEENEEGTSFRDGTATIVPIMPSYSLTQCLGLLNFWLMAIICGVGVGCGLAFVNSCSLVVASLDGPSEGRSVVITLFGIASCGGRLLFGVVPEKFLRAYGVPRPVFLAGAGFFMAFTCAGIAFAGVTALYALAGCAGFAFGAHWSLLPSLSSEIFGLDSFASVYTLLQLAPAAASYGFGAMLIASVYSDASMRHDDPAGSCLGPDCFRQAYLVMSGIAFGAGCLSIVLTLRTLRLYKNEAQALRSFDREVSERHPEREGAEY